MIGRLQNVRSRSLLFGLRAHTPRLLSRGCRRTAFEVSVDLLENVARVLAPARVERIGLVDGAVAELIEKFLQLILKFRLASPFRLRKVVDPITLLSARDVAGSCEKAVHQRRRFVARYRLEGLLETALPHVRVRVRETDEGVEHLEQPLDAPHDGSELGRERGVKSLGTIRPSWSK